MDVINAKTAVATIVVELDKFIIEPSTPAKFVTQCRRFKQALQNYVNSLNPQTSIIAGLERVADDNSNN